ncbi:DUF4430 domain-containing protein [Candidatus Saccharibacteria bacterium]|nr:DUF4430 domain-containing protein [Candidatus Saccharibacteria bacterium]
MGVFIINNKFKIVAARFIPYAIVIGFMVFVSAGSIVANAKFRNQEKQVSDDVEQVVSPREEDNATTSSEKASDESKDSKDQNDNKSPANNQPLKSGDTATTESSKPASSKSSAKPASSNKTNPKNTQPVTASVALSVNGVAKGSVSLTQGSNHCNVLTAALNAGLINSLDMRYSSQYNTNAVYKINGQGDANNIWWTFRVNGASPPYGCSRLLVKNGDQVNWQYVR